MYGINIPVQSPYELIKERETTMPTYLNILSQEDNFVVILKNTKVLPTMHLGLTLPSLSNAVNNVSLDFITKRTPKVTKILIT